MRSPLVAFRAVPPLHGHLAARCTSDEPAPADLVEATRRSLARYFTLLDRELASVDLERDEALFLAGMLNGTHVDEELLTVRHLDHEIEDADPWNDVDAGKLAAKVRGWTLAQKLAVVDAVERYWQISNISDHDQALRQVGLLPAAAHQ
jgi:hypothetical protein